MLVKLMARMIPFTTRPGTAVRLKYWILPIRPLVDQSPVDDDGNAPVMPSFAIDGDGVSLETKG